MPSVHETTFHGPTEYIPVGHERILLVDDEPQLLAMQRQMLARLGYYMVAMRDSLEALQAFRGAPETFDLLITDQTMPNLTGAELSGEVLKLRPDLPVILCTGFSEALTPEAAADIGIRHYLQKPIPLKALARTVRLALNDAIDDPPPAHEPRLAAAP